MLNYIYTKFKIPFIKTALSLSNKPVSIFGSAWTAVSKLEKLNSKKFVKILSS